MENVTFYNIIVFFLLFHKIGRNYCKIVPKTQSQVPPQSVHCHVRQYIVSWLASKVYLHQLLKKKLLTSGVEKSDLNEIYLLPFKATKEIKLAMFQYKIIHQILPTNSLLHKMKKVASSSCPFCPSECQTLWHLFINCKHASSFWNRFQEWYSTSSSTNRLLSNRLLFSYNSVLRWLQKDPPKNVEFYLSLSRVNEQLCA